MADENMDFADDLGHEDPADDYLDLDIDFTTGHHEDEDLMVEDVAAQELGDEHMHLPRQSPQHVAADEIMQSPHHTGVDDLMIDDEENGDHIFDPEVLDEYQHHMDDEAPSHSFVTVNETYNQYSEHLETTTTAGGDIDELNVLNWGPDDIDYEETGGQANETEHQGEVDESNVHRYDDQVEQQGEADEFDDQHYENETEQQGEGNDFNAHQFKDQTEQQGEVDELDVQDYGNDAEPQGEVDESNVQHHETEEQAKTASNSGSPTASPRQGSQEQLDVEESGSPSASYQEYQAVSQHGSPDSFSHERDQYEETHEEVDIERTSSRAYKGITVMYRDIEYSLFGTAVDDSDSYFLSDLSLAEKPMSEFFKEIRNVLSFEVLEQEELCVSIKHLGLDIEEISCPLHDVTIAQILDLHKKFLMNDEIMVHPLCMRLWTRINFVKRFEYLATAAAEGKSLSELDVLDQDSLQYNNSGQASEDPEDYNVAAGEDIVDEDSNPQAIVAGNNAEEEEIQYTIEQADEFQHDELETGEDQYYEENENGVDDTTPANPAFEDEGEEANGAQEEKQIRGDERVDEEGDLIDYSDDELDVIVPQVDKARPTTATRSSSLEGREAVNDDLQRRSLSRSAEHHVHVAAPEISQVVYTEDTFEIEIEKDKTEDNVNGQDGAADETYEYVDVGNADEHAGLDDQDDFDLSAGVDQSGDNLVDGASTRLDEFAELGDIFDENQQYLVPVDDEIDLTPPSEVPEINPSEEVAAVDWTNGFKNAPDTALSHPRTDASSSATASLNAQLKDELTDDDFLVDDEVDLEISHGDTKSAVEVNGDEIDYDENEYAEGLSTPSKDEHSNPLVASNGSGKRLWQELDDASIELKNDVKRIRS